VILAKAGLADGQGALQQGAGAVQVTLVAQDGGEVAEAIGGIGVIGAQAGLGDGQGAFVQAAGTVQVTLVAQDEDEVVEAGGGVGVVGTTTGLEDAPAQQLFCGTGPASKVLEG
jgi:hypothetical protein